MERRNLTKKRRPCVELSALIIFGFLALLLLCTAELRAKAMSEGYQELLTPLVTSVGTDFADINPMIIRRRAAYVRFGLLSEISTQDGNILRFNLFDDVTLDAVFTRRIKRSPSSYTWSGHIRGKHLGTFALAVEKDVMIANLTVPGEGAYQIRYLSDGLHEIREIDLTQIPPCAGALPAPSVRSGELTNDEQIATDDGCGADILVVYTPAARVAAGGTTAMQALVNLAVDESNIAYANSEINLRLRLVYQGEVSYTESGSMSVDLDRLTYNFDGYMDVVHSLRNTYGADLVSLLTVDLSYCGLAWLWYNFASDFEDHAFSIAAWDCAVYYTLVHEAGHNMGCAHATPEAVQGSGLFSYSMGWRFNSNTYRTIMAYSPGTQIQHFSNPDVTYDGFPTGVPVGLSNEAHNALSINNAASSIANWREHVVPYTPPTAENGGATAQIGAAVTITLEAGDEGCPDEMVYIITSLPSHGTLTDPGAGAISGGDLPYSLVGNGNQVTYTPSVDCYTGPDSFEFKANDGGTAPTGGDSNIATITIDVQPSASTVIYTTGFPSGLPAGWTIIDGGSSSDTWNSTNSCGRSSAYWTGTFMIVDSDCAGTVVMDEQLVTHSIDCSDYQDVTLKFKHKFWYWTTEIGDVDVRVNGGSWQNFVRYQGADFEGSVEVDISSVADGQSDVQVRWRYYNANWDWYWGIDDIELTGGVSPSEPMTGDFEPDCDVDFYDYAVLALAWGSSQGGDNWNPACDISEPKDGIINEPDLDALCENWLEGTSP